jgi:hypothetical protein
MRNASRVHRLFGRSWKNPNRQRPERHSIPVCSFLSRQLPVDDQVIEYNQHAHVFGAFDLFIGSGYRLIVSQPCSGHLLAPVIFEILPISSGLHRFSASSALVARISGLREKVDIPRAYLCHAGNPPVDPRSNLRFRARSSKSARDRARAVVTDGRNRFTAGIGSKNTRRTHQKEFVRIPDSGEHFTCMDSKLVAETIRRLHCRRERVERIIARIDRRLSGHVSDQNLEHYHLGMVTNEANLATMEKHLLWCRTCVDRASEISDYVDAVRAAVIEGNFDLD